MALLAVAILVAVQGGMANIELKSQLEPPGGQIEDPYPDPDEERVEEAHRRTLGRQAKVLVYGTYALAGLLLACWYWARIHPFAASLTGLALFVTAKALAFVAAPNTLSGRVNFLAVLTILVLIGGILSARKVRRVTKMEAAEP